MRLVKIPVFINIELHFFISGKDNAILYNITPFVSLIDKSFKP